MTATDEFRAMLDEMGVEWTDLGKHTTRVVAPSGIEYFVTEKLDGKMNLNVFMAGFTPKRLIDALFGDTCEVTDSGFATAFCSVCGAEFMGSIMTNEPPDYVKPLACCPECGRRIIKSNGKADD